MPDLCPSAANLKYRELVSNGADSTIEWRAHPARKRPVVAFFVLAFCSLVAVIAAHALGEDRAWLGCVFLLLLLGSVSSFLMPTDYLIDDEQLVVRHLFSTRRRLWKNVRRIELGDSFALVSTLRIKSRLDRYRSMVVSFEGAPEGARAKLASLADELSAPRST